MLAGLVNDYGVVAAGGGHVLLLGREAGQGCIGKHVVARRELHRFGEHYATAVIVRSLDRVAVAGLQQVAQMIGRRAPTGGFVAGLALVELCQNVSADLLAGGKVALGEGLSGVATGEAGVVGEFLRQGPRRGQGFDGLVLPGAAQNAHLKIPGFGAGIEALLGGRVQLGQPLGLVALGKEEQHGPQPGIFVGNPYSVVVEQALPEGKLGT